MDVMRKAKFVFIPLIIAATSFGQATNDEVQVAKDQLARQLNLLEDIEQFTERQDVGRLRLIAKTAKETLQDIEANGLGNFNTFMSYWEHVIKVRYSKLFFESITTDASSEAIREFFEIQEKIVADRFNGKDPELKIIASHYSEIKLNLDSILNENIGEDLDRLIRGSFIPIAKVISAGHAHGDAGSTDEAKAAYKAIRDLYAEFAKVSSSDSIFDLVVNIQALNEFVGEYINVEYEN